MNGGRVVEESKRSEGGRAARAALLKEYVGVIGEDIEIRKAAGVDAATDDLHDALALLWTAARISSGDAERIPEVVDFDPVGLDMAMWF
jgi:predicted RNase H-like nuclease